MKKIINASLALILLTVLVCGSLTSCKNTTFPWSNDTPAIEETIDSLVQAAVIDAINPTFVSADQAVVYRDLAEDGKAVDSVFYSMSDKQIVDVTTVLIGRAGSAKKKDIVEEFMNHSDIYKLLPPDDQTGKTSPTSMEDSGSGKAGSSGIISTQYKVYDDTIDGKPVKVQLKEEKSYVK